MENENKQKGRLIWIRKRNPDTGKLEGIAHWVNGDDVFALEKEDPVTGEWKKVVREVPENPEK